MEFESGHKGGSLEAMLLRWSDTSSGGPQIVLQLASRDDLEPFMAMTLAKGKIAGQRLKIVYVEIDDQEQEKALPGKGGPLSILAARWCQDAEFQAWALATFKVAGATSLNEETARKVILSVCGDIPSRRALDNDPLAGHSFDAYIRRPYMKHLQDGPRFYP